MHLGPTEYRLLEYLMRHPGRVYSREQLLDGVWGNDVYVDERTVDVHVGRLRKAINRGREAGPDPHRARRRLCVRRAVRGGKLSDGLPFVTDLSSSMHRCRLRDLELCGTARGTLLRSAEP